MSCLGLRANLQVIGSCQCVWASLFALGKVLENSKIVGAGIVSGASRERKDVRISRESRSKRKAGAGLGVGSPSQQLLGLRMTPSPASVP